MNNQDMQTAMNLGKIRAKALSITGGPESTVATGLIDQIKQQIPSDMTEVHKLLALVNTKVTAIHQLAKIPEVNLNF